jgi:Bacteriophage HK97-gp10, putative tail-component
MVWLTASFGEIAVANPAQFAANMNFRARTVRDAVVIVARKAALAAADMAIKSTRVDTGQLRSNWITTVDEPFDGTIPAYDELPRGKDRNKMGETANYEGAMAQCRGAVIRFSRNSHSIYIVNNLPYAPGINDGSIAGSQPGDHMVEKAAQVAAIAISGFRIFKD